MLSATAAKANTARCTGAMASQCCARSPARVVAKHSTDTAASARAKCTSQNFVSPARNQRHTPSAPNTAVSGSPSRLIDRPMASAPPAIHPPARAWRVISPFSASRAAATCQPWWSIRIGRICVATGTDMASTSADSVVASRPSLSHATRATSITTTASVSIGTISSAARSAPPAPSTGRSSSITPASGKSTSRDQCISTPPCAGSMRCWVRSNHPCPPSRSRTSTSRSASSGSGKRPARIGPALVASISSTISP